MIAWLRRELLRYAKDVALDTRKISVRALSVSIFAIAAAAFYRKGVDDAGEWLASDATLPNYIAAVGAAALTAWLIAGCAWLVYKWKSRVSRKQASPVVSMQDKARSTAESLTDLGKRLLTLLVELDGQKVRIGNARSTLQVSFLQLQAAVRELTRRGLASASPSSADGPECLIWALPDAHPVARLIADDCGDADSL